MTNTPFEVTILIDNPDSWITPYVEKLKVEIMKHKHQVRIVNDSADIASGDIVFLLGCEKRVPANILSRNKHNLVVHESALPQGKGWSPLTWQILEGKNEIIISLFEADEKIDSGPIYFQEKMNFEGTELIKQLRHIQGLKTIELCLKFLNSYPNVQGVKQVGKESIYGKRTAKDSQINPDKTIKELFNNFRVADNDNYPIFFELQGKKYFLEIEESKEDEIK